MQRPPLTLTFIFQYLQKPFPLTLACPCTTTLHPAMASNSLKTFIGHLQSQPCLPRQASSCLHFSSGLHIVAGRFSPEVAGRNPRVVVVGGGLAGGSAVGMLTEDGVEMFSEEWRLDNCQPYGGAMPLCLVGESNLPLDTTDRRVTEMQMTSPSNVVVDIGWTLKPHEYIRMARRETFDSYLWECASTVGTTVINGLFLKMDAPPLQSESHEVGGTKTKPAGDVHACTRGEPKTHGSHLKGFLHLGPTFECIPLSIVTWVYKPIWLLQL